MRYFDLYGTRGMSLQELADAAGAALGLSFVAREGLHKGAYFDADLADGGTIEVRPNYVRDFDEDEVMESRFADQAVLLYVHGTHNGPDLEIQLAQIPGLRLLRRDTRD